MKFARVRLVLGLTFFTAITATVSAHASPHREQTANIKIQCLSAAGDLVLTQEFGQYGQWRRNNTVLHSGYYKFDFEKTLSELPVDLSKSTEYGVPYSQQDLISITDRSFEADVTLFGKADDEVIGKDHVQCQSLFVTYWETVID